MRIQIKRQDNKESAPYIQEFELPSFQKDKVTVAKIIDTLNYRDDLFDIQGNPARRIRWECSCLQKMCGGCAMVINGMPGLACSVFIDTNKTELLKLEPLTKFPVVCDLVVDRSCILDYQLEAVQYMGSIGQQDPKEYQQQYSVAKCLKCGLCLEVCPNYVPQGKEFFGAVHANQSYLLYSMTGERRSELMEEYRKHFARYCSKSLACRSICPMGIQTLSSIGYMNRPFRKK